MLSVAKPLEARRRRSSARYAPRKQAGSHLIDPFAALSSVCVVLIARLLLLSFHKKQEDFFACWFVEIASSVVLRGKGAEMKV